MKLLVINAGSSSLKCSYYLDKTVEASLLIERIGKKDAKATLHRQNHTLTQETAVTNHHDAMILMEKLLLLSGALEDFDTLDGIGHRVVHGGEHFNAAVYIDSKVIKAIESVIPLTPLHNPANLEAIRLFQKNYPDIPQIAVFDTAFHRTIPEYASRYALPETVSNTLGIRRYGFHGTSHSYVAKEAAKVLGKPLASLRLITLHLGNGASACAIQNGRSIDTSMGMTPLEGLVMGTRSGDIDPAIVLYLQRQGYTLEAIDTLLNEHSGLTALCGTNDMREIIARVQDNDPKAILALEMFTYRIQKYIGAYTAALGGVDAIVFTGGIGEHAAVVREMVCERLAWLGVYIDRKHNQQETDGNRTITTPQSSVSVLVIPTDEALEIARQCEAILESSF